MAEDPPVCPNDPAHGEMQLRRAGAQAMERWGLTRDSRFWLCSRQSSGCFGHRLYSEGNGVLVKEALSKVAFDWVLDPSWELWPTSEQPFWDSVGSSNPEVLRWLIPQAPLQTLAGSRESVEWVDFVLNDPHLDGASVLEIDGDHKRQEATDRVRDSVLCEAGLPVTRASVEEAANSDRLIGVLRSEANKKHQRSSADTYQSPVRWDERWPRTGWTVNYTPLGARMRSEDPLDDLNGRERVRFEALASHAFVATSGAPSPVSLDVTYWATVCRKVLQRSRRPPISPRTESLLQEQINNASGEKEKVAKRALGPAALHRLALAIVEAAESGLLPVGESWRIDLEDPTGVVEHAAGGVLDTVAAIDQLWDTNVMPPELTIGSVTWSAASGRYKPTQSTSSRPPDLTVILDPYTPPHGQLPTGTQPTVVVRSAFLPVQPSWRKPDSKEKQRHSKQRRNITSGALTEGALQCLLEDLYGHPEFRERQLETVIRLLEGRDTAVMLPTGLGKSLIYQLAGLLRPGSTVVVDPLVSLIDDQARRLREDGTERSAALTARSVSSSDGEELVSSVGTGESFFVYFSPERLQRDKFRKQLKKAASTGLINLIVADEAHCVSEWGHDFRVAYLNLGKNLRKHCSGIDGVAPPLVALTATASPSVRLDMFRELDMDATADGCLQTPESHDRPNLHYEFLGKEISARRKRLDSVIFSALPERLGESLATVHSPRGGETHSGIVFAPHVNGKFGIFKIREHIDEVTTGRGVDTGVVMYGATLPDGLEVSQTEWATMRVQIAEDFVTNRAPILVATKSFGMGIDKPNIRYTIHYGMPPSIEAFAQESGRAGRDGKDSFCYLIHTMPDSEEDVEALLDVNRKFDERERDKDERNARYNDSDIDHQLYFHYKSFKGAQTEAKSTTNFFRELRDQARRGPGENFKIPQGNWPEGKSSAAVADLREKALYRLYLLGLVDDYVLEGMSPYNGKFVITLADYDAARIDKALENFAAGIEPGRGDALRAEIALAPADLDARCEHHIEKLLSILYRNIEPARIQALRAMYNLTLGDLGSEAIKARINAYLGQGLLASTLVSTITDNEDRVPAEAFVAALEVMPFATENERQGATDGQLADTPTHPIALLASSMTQALLREGNRDVFKNLLSRAFVSFSEYVPDDHEAQQVVEWLLGQVRTIDDARHAEWCSDIWQAWPADRAEALRALEDAVLEQGYSGNAPELQAVLERRLAALAENGQDLVLAETASRTQ